MESVQTNLGDWKRVEYVRTPPRPPGLKPILERDSVIYQTLRIMQCTAYHILGVSLCCTLDLRWRTEVQICKTIDAEFRSGSKLKDVYIIPQAHRDC